MQVLAVIHPIRNHRKIQNYPKVRSHMQMSQRPSALTLIEDVEDALALAPRRCNQRLHLALVSDLNSTSLTSDKLIMTLSWAPKMLVSRQRAPTCKSDLQLMLATLASGTSHCHMESACLASERGTSMAQRSPASMAAARAALSSPVPCGSFMASMYWVKASVSLSIMATAPM